MKRWIACLLALLMALSLAACGASGGNTTAGAGQNHLEKIKAQGYIEAAAEPYFAPYEFIDASKSGQEKDGTVLYVGCPAEERAGPKRFIARAGLFDNADFVYTWHPATVNEVPSKGDVAIMGANFIFDGVAAHLGRSALHAAELMNAGVNYLREHMLPTIRVHYAYSDAGGTAPNVVPNHAVIKYEVRAPKVSQMQELFAGVVPEV